MLFPIDNLTKKPKGFAFITYMIPENAVTALAQLDGHIFQVFALQLMFDISLNTTGTDFLIQLIQADQKQSLSRAFRAGCFTCFPPQ